MFPAGQIQDRRADTVGAEPDCAPARDDDAGSGDDLLPVVELDRELAPGAVLALQCEYLTAALTGESGGHRRQLSDGELLDLVEAAERMSRWAAGLRTRLVAAYADRHPPGSSAPLPGTSPASVVSPVTRWLPDELGMVLRIPRLHALGMIAESQRLAHVLPDTLDALQAGRIDERRADAISTATRALSEEQARVVEASVLAKVDGAMLRHVQDRARRAAHRIDPDGGRRRHRQAHCERRVTIASNEDGMASLWLLGGAAEVEASFTMVTRMARALGPGDPRTLDQRRSDLVTQILQGKLSVTDLGDVGGALTSALAAAATQTAPTAFSTASTATASTETGPTETGAAVTGAAATASTASGPTESGATATTGATATDPGETGATATGPTAETGATAETRATAETGATAEAGATAATATAATGGAATGGEASAAVCSIPEPVLLDLVTRALDARPQVSDTVRKPLIQVVVGLDTLLGSDRPAELVGHGPLPALTARALAAGGVWKRLVTDPLSGALLDHGRSTYTPPAALAEFVRARDQVCRGPQCTRPVRDGDLDHHIPFGGGHHGPTSEPNLHGLCRTAHVLKDLDDWQVLAHPDGRLTWISPAGRRTTTEPYDYREFTEELPRPAPRADPAACSGLGPRWDRPAVDEPAVPEGDSPAAESDDPPPF